MDGYLETCIHVSEGRRDPISDHQWGHLSDFESLVYSSVISFSYQL
jgi:hypothetical protein